MHDLGEQRTRKLAFTIIALYAVLWFVYGLVATQRGHHEDNGLWLITFAAGLVVVALLGLRLPILAGSILIVPSVLSVLLALAFGGPTALALFLLVLVGPLVAGPLFVVAGVRKRRRKRS